MPYVTNGTLTTNQKVISVSGGWDTQTQWNNYQSKTDVTVTNGTLELAEAVAAIDTFEDGDIAEYVFNTSEFATQQSVVQSGSYALECTTGGGGGGSHISSFSGLPNYPSAGDTFEFWARRPSGGSPFVLMYFGAQSGTGGTNDRPDGYAAFLNFNTNELILRKRLNGSNTTLASSAFTYSTGIWYRVVVDWESGGSITVTLYDSSGTQLQQDNATDTDFTSGGITWQASGPVYVDSAVML